MKAKRRSVATTIQGWNNNYQSQQSLSDDCHANLISIAKSIHGANEQYLSIVKEYLQWRARTYRSFSSSQKLNRFSDWDLQTIETLVQAQPPTSKSEIPQLLRSLGQTSEVRIWERAAENIAYLRGLQTHQRKHQDNGRKRADELRKHRVGIEACFRLVEKELQTSGFNDARDGISAKIDTLRKYEESYPLPFWYRLGFRFRRPSETTLRFILALIMTLSVFPMGVAWHKSKGEVGSTEDPDLYLLILNALFQIPGLAMSLCAGARKSPGSSGAWKYAVALMVGGILCAVASVPLYLCWPTMWSASLSFCATAAQGYVTVELAMMVGQSKVKQV
ncbi:hypothetical protein AAE478_007005 [Parahypoxylon ruwenzoriense]